MFVVVFCTASATAFYVLKKKLFLDPRPLTEQVKSEISDLMVRFNILFEALQLAAIGPYTGTLWVGTMAYSVLTLDFSEFKGSDFEDGEFFYIVFMIEVLCLLYFLISVLIVYRVDVKFENSCCFWFGYLSENLMPFFGMLFFIPFLVNLFEVFI
jgi:hypothetical protein